MASGVAQAPTRLAAPEAVTLTGGGTALRLRWQDGATTELSAVQLRQGCRCADCLRARVEWGPPRLPDDLRVTAVAAVGQYALNLAFSDRHLRGIYPWAYLADLAPGDRETA